VVAIVQDPKSGKILISKRRQDVMLGGLWEFPGGKVHQNESLTDALDRELTEEIGISVDIIHRLTTIKHSYSHFKIILTPFICINKQGIPRPKESDEIRWVSLKDLDQFPFPKANLKFMGKIREYYSGHPLI
jgi:A/G-specific adenine glycosylase